MIYTLAENILNVSYSVISFFKTGITLEFEVNS